MRLLLVTRFFPAVGGLETVMEILAHEWVYAGHEIRVATDVPGPAAGGARGFPFEVHHGPGPGQLLALTKWCDAYVQGCIGLKTLWPLILQSRLYVATHHTWYRRGDGSLGWQNRLKRWVSGHALNIAPSRAIAADLPAPCAVIPNPYRNDLFKRLPGSVRDRDLIFVGRLVSDKGVTLLLQAVAKLRSCGLRPGVTLVGDGPARPALELEAADLGLRTQVTFTGSKSPTDVAALLNQHRVFVAPSLWNEPFGVVALEAIACGCLVVSSEGGGLKEAIGPCGLTFPNGDVASLKVRLETLLSPGPPIIGQDEVAHHLAKHHPAVVAKAYLDVMLAGLNR